MGSRAIVVLTRDDDTARTRFGDDTGRIGAVLTRTGRPFFPDPVVEAELLARLRAAAGAAGLWAAIESDWLCLDGEVVPWNVKAESLIRDHYAEVGAAARLGLGDAVGVMDRIAARLPDRGAADSAVGLRDAFTARLDAAAAFTAAYRPYRWAVDGLEGVRLAPFHLLASAGGVHHKRPHDWHLAALRRLADADDVVARTAAVPVDLGDDATTAAATSWWEERTAAGAEGMVVKPAAFTVRTSGGLVQPAVKVRGREYLRLIYGAEYTLDLDRLRDRDLGRKRSLALREFALGVESLRRFVAREPLGRVHEAVAGVLALESDGVDPRL